MAVGNIGEPPVNEIDGRAHNEWFVAELSSYQIATTAELHPRVAVLLNITPDHLGWHKSHKNYALAKIKLFENMVDDDLVVIDVRMPASMSSMSTSTCRAAASARSLLTSPRVQTPPLCATASWSSA